MPLFFDAYANCMTPPLLAATGCHHNRAAHATIPAQSLRARPAPDPDLISPQHAAQLLAQQMPKLRGLSGPPFLPRVLIVDDAEFDQAIGEGEAPDVSVHLGLLLSFWDRSLDDKNVKSSPSNWAQAFYQTSSNCIYLRSARFADQLRNPSDALLTLAHEVEHYLQVGTEATRPPGATIDATLARMAVMEGDADLSADLFMNASAPAPKLLSALEHQASPTQGTLLVRVLGRVCTEGVHFVTGLYCYWVDFRLVDQVLRHLPASTAQVLHPRKYRDRESPTPLPTPTLPAGYARIADDSAGELLLDELLARCRNNADDLPPATGWSGDRFSIAKSAAGSTALSWLLTWDDDAFAARFATAVQAERGCLLASARLDSLDVVRAGGVVALTAGFPSDRNRALALQLLQSVTATTGPLATP